MVAFTDIHAHPSLKAWLWGYDMWRPHFQGRGWRPWSTRCDFPTLLKANVGTLWAAHYIIEPRLIAKSSRLERWIAARICPPLRQGVDGSPMQRLIDMIDQYEAQIAQHPDRAAVARSVAELTAIRRAGKLAVVHTVEGAHHLEGRLNNLDVLADRGVAMLTLTHFYPNGVAACASGVPRDIWLGWLFKPDPAEDAPLTEFGRAVIERAAERRMLLDLTHCTPAARRAIYALNANQRPLVASHIGLGDIGRDGYYFNDDDLRAIAATGGVVGVICMAYWLNGTARRDALDDILRHIMRIREVTGSFDHIAIGSDFDGFTIPPDDIALPTDLHKIADRLTQAGVSPTDIEKIAHTNAQRVLEQGWR